MMMKKKNNNKTLNLSSKLYVPNFNSQKKVRENEGK